MKILIISDFYKPGFKGGGPIQSLYNLSKLLADSYEIFVITRNHDLGSDHNYDIRDNEWVNLDNHSVKYLNDNDFRYSTIMKNVSELQPRFIYFNSLFSSLTFRFVFKFFVRAIPTSLVIAPRGQLDIGALNLKTRKKKLFLFFMQRILRREIIFHATTYQESERIRLFFPNPVLIAPNVPNLILDKPERLMKEKDVTNFVFISRISPKKNLGFCFNIFDQLKVTGEMNFYIIGPIEDMQYWKSLSQAIKKIKHKVNVHCVGPVSNENLLEVTKNHHFLFFPTMGENYGHVIYEALSYGIPVVLSDNTPWLEDNNGVFVRSLDDEQGFIRLIQKLHGIEEKEYQILSNLAFEYAKKKINLSEITKSYKTLFNANHPK